MSPSGAKVLPHPLRLGGRPQRDQVPAADAAETRAGRPAGGGVNVPAVNGDSAAAAGEQVNPGHGGLPPRMKERKKYGLKAARRAPQFSKR